MARPQIGLARGGNLHDAIDRHIPWIGTDDRVNVELNFEQSARMELLSLYAGRPAEEMLLEAATFLMDCEEEGRERCLPAHTQNFLSDEGLEARFALLLHR